MTRILAIETATAACSAALSIDGEIAERFALAPRQHAALILPMIESLFVEADIGVSALDAVAFGRGPGSFTGVRIAASAVQGIAFGADLPVIPVSTLAALAQGVMRETGTKRVMAALDARMHQVYWGIYQQGESGLAELQGEESVCNPGSVVFPGSEGWTGAGSGWESYGEALMQRVGTQVVRVLPDIEPRAGDIARLGIQSLVKEQVCRADEAIPVYLRDRVVRKQ